MWNNIATLAEVLENKPPRNVRKPDKGQNTRQRPRNKEEALGGAISPEKCR